MMISEEKMRWFLIFFPELYIQSIYPDLVSHKKCQTGRKNNYGSTAGLNTVYAAQVPSTEQGEWGDGKYVRNSVEHICKIENTVDSSIDPGHSQAA